MGKELMVDVEEGEISDSASVEEITAEVFSSKSSSDSVTQNQPNQNKQNQNQQVWTMEDLMKYQKKYQTSRNYAPGLYNFAWAQAVQNKPLDDYLTTMNNNNNNTSKTVSNDDDNKIVLEVSDSDKEEGELEEGEIDMDIDTVNGNGVGKEGGKEGEKEGNNVEKLSNVIRIGLEGITVIDANKSFDEVCCRLVELMDNLSKLLSENLVSNKDDLVKLAFSAVQLVNLVFCDMSQNQKEGSREIMSRVLTNVKNYMPAIFSPEQLKEVEIMFLSCKNNNDGEIVTSKSEESVLDAMAVKTLDQKPKESETLYIQTSISKNNRVLLPLLDLHKDHDVDSLPSPTRETTHTLPLGKALFVRDTEIRPEWPTPRAVLHRYETDGLKAVSTYQQKFSRSSFLANDLPSPTPSEDSGDAGGGDCGGEISSFSSVQYPSFVTEATAEKREVLSSPPVERPTVQLLANAKSSAPVYSTASSVTRVPNKTRDPRLRLNNPESTLPLTRKQPIIEPLDSRKQKTSNESVLVDGPASKRQKSDFVDSFNPRNVAQVGMGVSYRSGNVISEATSAFPSITSAFPSITSAFPSSTSALPSTTSALPSTTSALPSTSSGSVHIPVTGINPTSASLQSILKDIAVNPAQWMHLINMEQQKSLDPAKFVTQSPSQNSFQGSLPMTTVASQPLVIGQRATSEMQIPQTTSADVSGKVRMKPRDPRRALHSKPLQKAESITNLSSVEATKGKTKKADPRLSSSQSNSAADPRLLSSQLNSAADPRLLSSQPNSAADPRLSSSQPNSVPDITRQFTKNLKNIADLVSTTVSASVQTTSSLPAQVHSSLVNIKVPPSQPVRLQNGSGQTSEEVSSSGPTQSNNPWDNVEQYFGRFDDQQRAAIHRERSKRMDEQKKMFADRKLCLVLDLDHTLLNSAKFSEIEPVHEEMLKKKEEQDRDKTHRHLFRFPHMCMWTKLRPGVWNFLEKASKLFELHLYTMGNKLYATEMAKVLDPKGVLFNGRVISRGDDGDSVDGDPKSKDLEGVLGMESAVVIIDDSIRVWPHNKLNLIVVERYIYFPCSRRQFGLPGPSLLEIDHDERPEDGTLASSLSVIEKIHQTFFLEKSLDDADVRNILASEQRKILGGCRIVFSRVFPVGEASPHLHPLWQTAEQFGAVCTNQIDDQVTHVVANSLGTDKVNWALATGRPVVHPGWVEASALLYRRANEHDFAVKP